MPNRIGIFGGTFDPPHLGHLILAAEAQAQLGLDRVLWVLTPQPPHKPERAITSLEHRLEMLRRTIHGCTGFELSLVEMERTGPHYTIDTLSILQQKDPTAKLVLLIGGDSLRDLPGWSRPAEIVAAVHALGVMRRPDDRIELETLERLFPGISSKIRFVDAPRLDISSSLIRQRIAGGGHYRYYLPPGVYDYIQKNHLYRVTISSSVAR
ncbi:MAG: nicotinate-nucleotide adenylyltransferase [Anaerolineales bacterium]|nr:nicotinate-nucleotide adenylyltransferase [Anaerolineales bacterium]